MSNRKWLAQIIASMGSDIGGGFQRGVEQALSNKDRMAAEGRQNAQSERMYNMRRDDELDDVLNERRYRSGEAEKDRAARLEIAKARKGTDSNKALSERRIKSADMVARNYMAPEAAGKIAQLPDTENVTAMRGMPELAQQALGGAFGSFLPQASTASPDLDVPREAMIADLMSEGLEEGTAARANIQTAKSTAAGNAEITKKRQLKSEGLLGSGTAGMNDVKASERLARTDRNSLQKSIDMLDRELASGKYGRPPREGQQPRPGYAAAMKKRDEMQTRLDGMLSGQTPSAPGSVKIPPGKLVDVSAADATGTTSSTAPLQVAPDKLSAIESKVREHGPPESEDDWAWLAEQAGTDVATLKAHFGQ